MTYELATRGKNRSWFSILITSARWEIGRLGLVWAGFALAAWLTYLAVFTLVYWFATLLLREVDRNIAIFLTTLITLFLLPSLYDWSQRMVDNLFFPDTADFKEKVETLCQKLTEINQREELKHFLVNSIPYDLRVTEVFLHEEPRPAPVNALTLPLEMGRHSLGFLIIGPRRSGRSFGYKERLALTQLQEQISLVLSSIQLTEARKAAERTGQLKVNFLTNLSHQLRTPLNTVINSTGLVADGALGETNETQTEYLQRAVQGSEHLLKLLNDILDITKIEAGQLALRPESIDLKEVIAEAVAMVRGMLRNKPVEIKIELAADLPALTADRLRIRQILLNLLANGIKFTQAGMVRVQAWSDSKLVYVSVEDTGIGITPEKLSLVFEDYQQVSTDRDLPFERRRHAGTGLGLPITRALVELHGGQISVNSEPNRGTTFTFTLPLGLNPARRTAANGRLKGATVNVSY